MDQHLATIPQHHGVSKLLGFDFDVEYKPGRLNTVADALSRRDADELASFALSGPVQDWVPRLQSALASDPALQALRDEITSVLAANPGQSLMEW